MATIWDRCLSLTILAIFNIFLGLFALFRNPHNRLNQTFVGINFSLCFWSLGVYSLFIPNVEWANFSFKLAGSAAWVYIFCYVYFLQILIGIDEHPSARFSRKALLVLLIATYPLHFTDLIMKGVKDSSGVFILETHLAGPYYSLFWILLVSGGLWGNAVIFRHWKESSGTLRNQMKYILLMTTIGIMACLIRVFQEIHSLLWAFTGLMLAAYTCFAYAIFKHNLFEFNLLMRRLTIYLAVYIPLLALPFLFPLNQAKGLSLPMAFLIYALLFSLAPFLTNFIRDKAEHKRWADLNHHLSLILTTSQGLANRSRISIHQIGQQLVTILKKVYWENLKNPLRSIRVGLKSYKGDIVETAFPSEENPSNSMLDVVNAVKALPFSFFNEPMTRLELRRELSSRHPPRIKQALTVIQHFFIKFDVEVAIPCYNDKKLYGAFFLGAKESGVFSNEELKALQVSAAHVATAVRKRELVNFTKKLAGLDKVKSDLISNITHDFKSPIHVIENAVQILLDQLSKTRLRRDQLGRYVQMIRNNNSQLSVFIQSLLDVVKIEKSKISLKPIPCELNSVVQEAVNLFIPMAENKKLKLIFKPHPTDIDLEVDIPKINQAVCNLISNAIRYSERGRIQVGVGTEDGQAQVWVEDSGQGMDPKNLPFIFKKFFSVSDSTQPTEGTGLGLAIAKGWVEAHRGQIWAETKGVNKGMKFTFTLPLPAYSLNTTY